MAKKRYKKEQVRDALKQSHGLKTGACEILGCNFDTLQRYIAEDTEAEAIVFHWRNRRKDRAEYKLDEAIERGESWAIMFTLKNAKDREYSDRVDISSNGESLKVEFDYGKLIAGITPRPTEDSGASSQDESNLHGQTVGKDDTGGDTGAGGG